MNQPKQQFPIVEALSKNISKVENTLPMHIKGAHFIRRVELSLTNNAKLSQNAAANTKEFLSLCMTAATCGFELGFHAHLLPFGDKVQLVPTYKGALHLINNTAAVNVNAPVAVYDNDEFYYYRGMQGGQDISELRHVPTDSERGKVKAVYICWTFTNTKRGDFLVLTLSDILDAREHSAGYKRNPKQSPWTTHFAEMAKKTAILRAAKVLPFSFEHSRILDGLGAEVQGGEIIDTTSEITAEGKTTETATAAAQPPKRQRKAQPTPQAADDGDAAADDGAADDDVPPAETERKPASNSIPDGF